MVRTTHLPFAALAIAVIVVLMSACSFIPAILVEERTVTPTAKEIANPNTQLPIVASATQSIAPQEPTQFVGAVIPSIAETTANCIDWHEATSHLTETSCVRGIVAGTFTDARRGADYPSIFIYFDLNSQPTYGFTVGFYADSVLKWESLSGRCVEISGYIEPNRYGPLMHIFRPDQLSYCEPETANLTPTVIGMLATPTRPMLGNYLKIGFPGIIRS